MSLPVNPDLAVERHSNLDLEQLKRFIGELEFYQPGEYEKRKRIRKELVARIKPIHEENFYNLDRNEKYEMIYKKTLEMYEYADENNLDKEKIVNLKTAGSVLGPERLIFVLHFSTFVVSINMWGTNEQSAYWREKMKNNSIFGTYAQTELGHGTFVRGLETTATYDKNSQEFIIDSPTLTSIKFWPGSAGRSCNHAIVMAKLIIDQKENGIHAFIVPLRSLEDHTVLPGVEVGDIGKKFGFEGYDNGYLKFNKVRIPRNNMLMKSAMVTPNGEFKKIGSELIMYSCMLVLRGYLCLYGTSYLSLSTTIAIRYSCVRRQTADSNGVEPKIIEYQTQQYRLFPALASTYAHFFTACYFIQSLERIRDSTNYFVTVQPDVLNKLHAVSAGLKAVTMNNALKFSQSNRLCCGGHGYSASSGLTQIIQDTDAGCTYEGDNIVLLLQTARYLLKCAQNDVSPHFELPNMAEIKNWSSYPLFENYLEIYTKLYEESISEASKRILYLINEKGLSQYDAWSQSTVILINVSKVYIGLFMTKCFLIALNSHKNELNQKALTDLFELYLLYDICDNFAANILRLNVISSSELSGLNEKLYNLLPKIRVNAVLLVDAFDWLDSNLCSSLGAYDGNVYEKLYEFAKNSKFNQKEVLDSYEKYLKPYALRYKQKAKL